MRRSGQPAVSRVVVDDPIRSAPIWRRQWRWPRERLAETADRCCVRVFRLGPYGMCVLMLVLAQDCNREVTLVETESHSSVPRSSRLAPSSLSE